MMKSQDLVQLLREQQEKVLALSSAVGLIAAAAKALWSKSDPPIVWLAVFSALMIAAVVWMIIQRRRASHAGSARTGYSRRQIALVGSIGTLVLMLAWGIVYRERILYSELLASLSDDRRALVSSALAWELIPSKGLAGQSQSNSVAGEVASLLEHSRFRVVVVDTRQYHESDRDAFVLEGVREGAGLSISAEMVVTPQRLLELIRQLEQPWRGYKENMVTPLRRFLPNEFLESKFKIVVPVPANASADHKILVSRLVARDAAAMSLYFDEDTSASRVFDEILTLAGILPEGADVALAHTYLRASHYFAMQGQLDKAIAALDVVQRLNPADRRAARAKGFLLLADARIDDAGVVIQSLTADPSDPAALPTLQGEHAFARRDFDRAILAFREALTLEREDVFRRALLTNITLAYGMHDRITDASRSREMIRHLEAAIGLKDDVAVLHILQGYAWALQKNARLSGEAFTRAYQLIPEEDEENKKFHRYWLARSLLFLSHSPAAVDTLKRLVEMADSEDDAGLLVVFAENLLEIPGREGEAEAYLDKAIELDPTHAKAHREKGVVVARRYLKALASGTDADSLNKTARFHLLQSIRLKEEKAGTHMLLALLYESGGDTINAEGHSLRACVVDPTLEDCVVRAAERLVEGGDFVKAQEMFRQLRDSNPHDASLPLREALIWYKFGRLTEAENAGHLGVQLDPKSSTAHNNLAFVLFDQHRPDEALGHWERALKIESQSADALAGKAIALYALGNEAEAAKVYARAARIDRRYLDCAVLRKEFLWSDIACGAAAPLIANAAPLIANSASR